MFAAVPDASTRRQVTVPLRLVDGYSTTARMFSFDGLADGREHVAFALGEPGIGGEPRRERSHAGDERHERPRAARRGR